MKIFKKIIIISSAVFILFSCADKNHPAFRVVIEPAVIEVTADTQSFIPVRFEIPAGSHIYGNPKGPGTGLPTTVSASAENKGITFSEARFLPPVKFTAPGDSAYTWVYEHETTVYIPAVFEGKLEHGTYPAVAEISALLCDYKGCVLYKDSPGFVLKTGSAATDMSPHISSYLISSAPSEFRGSPENSSAVRIDNNTQTENSVLRNFEFRPGILNSVGITGLLQAVLLGLLAGVFLNFMPCVLPVVSLKVMSLVKHADRDRKELFVMGAVFSLGILASALVLASLAAFFGYTWGGLFQHRLFLIIMAGIVFALALSMFDVYVINVPSFIRGAARERSNHYADAFMKGILTTFLATPCSGPFLGGTLAWALTRPAWIIFIVFMSIGVGMAAPYMLLTVKPRLIKYIPRPGEWMHSFEQLMGFFLVFTVVYLVSILDNSLIKPMVLFLTFIGIAFWQYGKLGTPVQPALKRRLSAVLLVIIVAAGYYLSFEYFYGGKTEGELVFGSYSNSRLIENRNSGQVSLVKFTADWCPNCKVVEKVSLQTEEVAGFMHKHNIDFMSADLTVQGSEGEELLKILGSKSIPFLAVFPPGEGFLKPLCLTDIYSEKDVLEVLGKAVDQL